MNDDIEDINWESDPIFNGFLNAVCEAEDAAGKLVMPYERAVAWAAIAAAYGQLL